MMVTTMTKEEAAGDFGRTVLEMIAALERRKGATLSIEQKILLAETGTVEQVLSILTGSAVKVKVVRQTLADSVIRREVVISSAASGRLLVRARSKVYCKVLPAEIVRKLMQEKRGIGTIIHNAGLETCRRLIRFGLGPGKHHPYRVYRIMHKGKTAFEIREDILI
jgi:chorismate-pyruvate lyase